MLGRTRLPLLSLITIIVILSIYASAVAETKTVYGQAFSIDGQFEYLEKHLITYRDERIAAIQTTFYNAHMQKIAKQVSDFSYGAQFGSYDFFDERHQYSDGARVLPDRILLYRQKSPGSQKKEKYIPKKTNQIVGQGFYQYVTDNLDYLARGQNLSAKLVLPAQMGQFKVQIRKQSIQGDRIRLAVKLENWFLRLFAPNIEVEYDLNTRQLMRYRGISLVSNKNRKNFEVVTTYDYSEQPSLLGFETKLQKPQNSSLN